MLEKESIPREIDSKKRFFQELNLNRTSLIEWSFQTGDIDIPIPRVVYNDLNSK